MNMEFYRKLPIPMEVKKQFPLSDKLAKVRVKQIEQLKEVFEGKSNKKILVIGPCSADSEAPVLDYIGRLRDIQEIFLLKDRVPHFLPF